MDEGVDMTDTLLTILVSAGVALAAPLLALIPYLAVDMISRHSEPTTAEWRAIAHDLAESFRKGVND
jgi:hypothetical protein